MILTATTLISTGLHGPVYLTHYPLYLTLTSEVCTLLPTKDSVLRIFVAISRCGDSFNCCIISTCHKNVMKVTNGPLSAVSLHHASQLTVLHALIQASHVVESGWQVEIFAQHISSFAFARYGAHLSEVERLCVDATAPYRENLRLIVCQPSSTEGIQLALAGCDIPGSGLNVLPQLLISKTCYRHSIGKLVRNAWQTEWQACYNSQLTENFSPRSNQQLCFTQTNSVARSLKSSHATLSSKNISFASILPLLQSVIVGPTQSQSLISYFTALSSLHNTLYFLRLVPLRMATGLDLSPLYQLIPTSGKRSLLSSAQPNVCDGIAHRIPYRLGLTGLCL